MGLFEDMIRAKQAERINEFAAKNTRQQEFPADDLVKLHVLRNLPIKIAPAEIDYGNGQIPSNRTAYNKFGGKMLNVTVPAFNHLYTAIKEKGINRGVEPTSSRSYATFPEQVKLKAEKPRDAATPGNPYWGNKPFEIGAYAWEKLGDDAPKNISTKLSPKLQRFVAAAKNEGYRIGSTYRSPDDSDKGFGLFLSQLGRTGAPIVPGGTSGHNYGKAADVYTTPSSKPYTHLYAIAEKMGVSPLYYKDKKEEWHFDDTGDRGVTAQVLGANKARLAKSIPVLMQEAWKTPEKAPTILKIDGRTESEGEFVDRMVSAIASNPQVLSYTRRHLGEDYDFGEVLAAQAELAQDFYGKNINKREKIRTTKPASRKTKRHA